MTFRILLEMLPATIAKRFAQLIANRSRNRCLWVHTSCGERFVQLIRVASSILGGRFGDFGQSVLAMESGRFVTFRDSDRQHLVSK